MAIKKHYIPPKIETDEIESSYLLAGSPRVDWITGENGDGDEPEVGGDDNGEGGLLNIDFIFEVED